MGFMLPVNNLVYLWILPLIGFGVLWQRFRSSPDWRERTLGPTLLTVGAALSLLRHFLLLPAFLNFVMLALGFGLVIGGAITLAIAVYNKQQEI